ncbi:hypothetical protein AA313_de0203098 [Arthrobotrys entomopaga]|nr:hypothetical protein AA313_de0203098 [Arthrobotrys entomopaga]
MLMWQRKKNRCCACCGLLTMFVHQKFALLPTPLPNLSIEATNRTFQTNDNVEPQEKRKKKKEGERELERMVIQVHSVWTAFFSITHSSFIHAGGETIPHVGRGKKTTMFSRTTLAS